MDWKQDILTIDKFVENRPDMSIHVDTAIQSAIYQSAAILDSETNGLLGKVWSFNAVDPGFNPDSELKRDEWELSQLVEAMITQTQYILNMGNDLTQGGGSYSIGNINTSWSRPENRDIVAPGVYKLLQNGRVYKLQSYGFNPTKKATCEDSKDRYDTECITRQIGDSRYVEKQQDKDNAGNVAVIGQSGVVTFANPNDLNFSNFSATRIKDWNTNDYVDINKVTNQLFRGQDLYGVHSGVQRGEVQEMIAQSAGRPQDYDQVKAQVEANKQDIANLNNEVSDNTQNIATNTQEIANVANRVNTTNIQVENNKNKIEQVIQELRDSTLINYVGEYANGTTYKLGQVVSYQNKLYLCKVDTTTNNPSNSNDWDLLSAPEVNLSNYYNKQEIDTKLSEKSNKNTWLDGITPYNNIQVNYLSKVRGYGDQKAYWVEHQDFLLDNGNSTSPNIFLSIHNLKLKDNIFYNMCYSVEYINKLEESLRNEIANSNGAPQDYDQLKQQVQDNQTNIANLEQSQQAQDALINDNKDYIDNTIKPTYSPNDWNEAITKANANEQEIDTIKNNLNTYQIAPLNGENFSTFQFSNVNNIVYSILNKSIDKAGRVNGQATTILKVHNQTTQSNNHYDTYNTKYINEKLSTKQNTLTAGQNITIVDNVISATGGNGNVDLSNYYTKEEIDNSLNSKSDVNTWLDGKTLLRDEDYVIGSVKTFLNPNGQFELIGHNVNLKTGILQVEDTFLSVYNKKKNNGLFNDTYNTHYINTLENTLITNINTKQDILQSNNNITINQDNTLSLVPSVFNGYATHEWVFNQLSQPLQETNNRPMYKTNEKIGDYCVYKFFLPLRQFPVSDNINLCYIGSSQTFRGFKQVTITRKRNDGQLFVNSTFDLSKTQIFNSGVHIKAWIVAQEGWTNELSFYVEALVQE